MHRIYLFVEDFGHETVLSALLQRLASEMDISIKLHPRSVRGGHGKMGKELRQFIQELEIAREGLPDLLIIARDANCKGFTERKKEIDESTKKFAHLVVCAIPDPHIERWLLLDSSAFKAVLGKGCNAPDHKCERHRYKYLLHEAVRNAGVIPLLGGMEHAEALVNKMDLLYLERIDPSFGHLLKELRSVFNTWKQE